MRSNGSDKRQLTEETFRLLNNPYWSPDGRYIAARKHFTTTRSLGTGEIWIWHRFGGDGIAVIERPNETHQKELGEPAFSPDGRYLYFSVDSTPGGTFEYAQDSNDQVFEIRRHDLHTGSEERFAFEDGVYGSETAMAPRANGTGEEDGYLVTITTDMNADASYCLVLDAARVSDGPVCKLALPERVSSGTHCTWASGAELRRWRI